MDIAPQTFTIAQGESLEIPVTNRDEAGTVINLTGASFIFRLAPREGGTTIVGTEISPANATASADAPPTAGVSRVVIDKAVTDGLLGSYYWEHWVIDASGNQVLTARGRITVGARVITT